MDVSFEKRDVEQLAPIVLEEAIRKVRDKGSKKFNVLFHIGMSTSLNLKYKSRGGLKPDFVVRRAKSV